MVIDKIVSNTDGTIYVAAGHFDYSESPHHAVLLHSSDGESWSFQDDMSIGASDSSTKFPYFLDLCYANDKFWTILYVSDGEDVSAIYHADADIVGTLYSSSDGNVWTAVSGISNAGTCGVIDGELWVKAGASSPYTWYAYNSSTFLSIIGTNIPANFRSPTIYCDGACSPIDVYSLYIPDGGSNSYQYVLRYYDPEGTDYYDINTGIERDITNFYISKAIIANGHIILSEAESYND